MNPKIRGYLRSLHPELGSRIKVGQLLEKYPQMQAFLDAVTGHVGGGVNPRSLSSIKSNIERAYALMNGKSGGSSIKRKAVGQPDTQPADKVQKVTAAEATPFDLIRAPVVNETREAPILEQLASERDMNKPFGAGRETAPTGEAVENTGDQVPSYSIRSQNFPNVSAESTEKALDMAELDPFKPTKELTTLPTFADNALLTQQEEYYLQHRNTNSLAQVSFSTPAAALTTNYGDGVREGIRRRDTDVEMEEEKQDLRLQEKVIGGEGAGASGAGGGGGGGGGRFRKGGGGRAGYPDKYVPQESRASNLSQGITLLGRGVENLSSQLANQVKAAWIKDQAAIVRERRENYIKFNPGATREEVNAAFPEVSFGETLVRNVANNSVNFAIDQARNFAGGVGQTVREVSDHYDLKKKAQEQNFPLSGSDRRGIDKKGIDIFDEGERKGIDKNRISAFIEQLNAGQGDGPPRSAQEVDDLRPFMPMAGSSDVELAPGENEQKMRNESLFSNYKPANWPLGNMDNALYLQNLVLQGVRWESPLDNIPPVLPGGSILQGAQEFTSEIPLPDISTLQLIAMENQMEFKVPKSGCRVMLHNTKKMATSMREAIIHDVLWSYNPMAAGNNNPQVFSSYELNPLHSQLFPDLRVGGSEPLRNLYGPSDAFSTYTQIGQDEPNAPMQSYAFGPQYNLHAARFGYH